jgi:hypothetical protein
MARFTHMRLLILTLALGVFQDISAAAAVEMPVCYPAPIIGPVFRQSIEQNLNTF